MENNKAVGQDFGESSEYHCATIELGDDDIPGIDNSYITVYLHPATAFENTETLDILRDNLLQQVSEHVKWSEMKNEEDTLLAKFHIARIVNQFIQYEIIKYTHRSVDSRQ